MMEDGLVSYKYYILRGMELKLKYIYYKFFVCHSIPILRYLFNTESNKYNIFEQVGNMKSTKFKTNFWDVTTLQFFDFF